MKSRYLAYASAVVMAAVVLVALAHAQQKGSAAPSIEGTYILESRDLPDGTTMKPPDITGLLTYSGKYRNFNIGWKTPDGKHQSLSLAAEYSLTGDTYKETSIFWLDNSVMGSTLSYTPPPDKDKASKVTMEGSKISFQVAGEPPVMTFDGNVITADAKGLFVDHWKKVK